MVNSKRRGSRSPPKTLEGRAKARAYDKEWRRKNPDKVRAKHRRHNKRASLNLTDAYIKALIHKAFPSLPPSSIPADGIEAKRSYLKIVRLLKK